MNNYKTQVIAEITTGTLNMYKPFLDKDIVGSTEESAKFYNTALFVLLLQRFKTVPINHSVHIKLGLVKGHVWYWDESMIRIGHEWIDVDGFVLDMTIDKILNPGLENRGMKKISPIVLQLRQFVPTHTIVEMIPPPSIEDRLDVPLILAGGQKTILFSYIKDLVRQS